MVIIKIDDSIFEKLKKHIKKKNCADFINSAVVEKIEKEKLLL